MSEKDYFAEDDNIYKLGVLWKNKCMTPPAERAIKRLRSMLNNNEHGFDKKDKEALAYLISYGHIYTESRRLLNERACNQLAEALGVDKELWANDWNKLLEYVKKPKQSP